MDLTSRLRAVVGSGAPRPAEERPIRELRYEPDDGYRNGAVLDLDRVAQILGGRRITTRFGDCLVVDRRYESDRWHGDVQIGDCAIERTDALKLLDPALPTDAKAGQQEGTPFPDPPRNTSARAVFVDLETTGLSGGAGTLAFLVGCGYFDLGAFQVRQFLLTSHSAERALLAAVAEIFEDADLIVTYNGKTFDVPVMETRWSFHRIEMPSIGGEHGVPHFDMLHPARRLWKNRMGDGYEDAGCRLSTLERTLFDVQRVGDVPGFDIPGRFFQFVRSGDPRPLEPVLEHNRIDLVSLAAVTARAARLTERGHEACRDCAEALALGKIFEKAGHVSRAEACYRHAAHSPEPAVRADALCRLAIRLRRDRRFEKAASVWRDLVDFTAPRSMRRGLLGDLRKVAIEALAIHQEHRAKDFAGARELALSCLEEGAGRVEKVHHRLARLDRKLARRQTFLFS
jgi:uncharacterized protein YprB with RNaseH-like and TPR domain